MKPEDEFGWGFVLFFMACLALATIGLVESLS